MKFYYEIGRKSEQEMKMDDKMKSLLKKFKSEKKKNEYFDKIKQLEIELIKVIFVKNPSKKKLGRLKENSSF